MSFFRIRIIPGARQASGYSRGGEAVTIASTTPMADSARWNDIDRVAGFEPFVRGFLVEYEP